MATIDLLKRVLPPEGTGYYCILGLKDNKDKPPVQSFHKTLQEVTDQVEELLAKNFSMYFACAKYEDEDEGRTQKNSVYFKSFWLDIDCGVAKPYATQAIGLEALAEFCLKIKLPLPTIVDSGRGIHAYWELSEVISREQWLPVAKRLKYLCQEHGFEVDPSRTAESASVLRVPETLNFKQDPPLPTSILATSKQLSYDNITKKLGVLIAPSHIKQSFNESAKLAKSNQQSRFKTIMIKTLNGQGCNQLKDLVENQDTMDEPRWRAGLSIAAFCIDRDTAIHAISEGHPEYDGEATEKKANEIKGPYTCEKMESYNPGKCEGCVNKGRISNPIQLGLEIIPANKNAVVVEADEEGEVVEEYKVPEYPFPYFRGKNGGVYMRVKDEDDDGDATVNIYEHDLYVVKMLNDPKRGDMTWIRLHLPRDGTREFALPLTDALTPDKLRDKLAWYGVIAGKKQMESIMAYLIKFTKELQHKAKVEKMRTQFGWADNDTKFILGDKEISATGVTYSPPSSSTGSLAIHMEPTGNFDDWKAIANTYNQKGFEPHAFGFFTAFGSPLLKHLNIKGAIINLINEESGTGKSTVLKMCNSVWGHPEELMLQWKDTMNTMIHRLGIMNNIPVTIDEITKLSGDSFSDLAYSISQGRGKNRMMQHENAERKNDTKWAAAALCSSNASFMDKLAALKATPDGEYMRTLEYRVDATNNLTKEEADTIFNGLYTNYGYAGLEYAKHLVANLEGVIDTVVQVQQKLDAEVGFTSRERFWSATAACNIAGALIAKDLNIIPDFDIGRVYRWLVKELIKMRTETKAPTKTNQASTIGEFMNEHRASTLVINGNADARSGMEQLPIVEPKFNDLLVRIEPDTKLLFINAKHLRTYCSKHQIDLKNTLKGLEADKIYMKQVKKRLSKGTKLQSPAVDVYVFDLNNEHFLDAEQYINADTRD
jgi:hypothetical protein